MILATCVLGIEDMREVVVTGMHNSGLRVMEGLIKTVCYSRSIELGGEYTINRMRELCGMVLQKIWSTF